MRLRQAYTCMSLSLALISLIDFLISRFRFVKTRVIILNFFFRKLKQFQVMKFSMMIPFQPLCLAHTAHGLYEQKINAKAYGEKRSHFHAGSKEIRALKTELIKRRRTETSWQQYSRCLMVSTDQADPSCFYFRMSWILRNYIEINFLVAVVFCRASEART